jgi:DNA (cytosine-5)-methyltransferase 1
MKFGSVCSGIEAASVAWHPLGWQAAWLSEIEPFPSAVLAHHYPSTPNLGDMTLLPERIASGEVEAPDIFCGGTPCQAFSVAGLRESLGDARGNLTLTFVEIANAIDLRRIDAGHVPAIIFWENVPGVLNTKDNAFGCFLGALAGEDEPLIAPGGRWSNAGCVYGPQRAVAWRVLDAQYFGVAQRRRRVFVVASAREDFDPAAVLFESGGVRRDTAPSREAGQSIAPCVTNGPPFSRTGNERVEAEAMVVQGVEIGPSGGKFTDLNPTLDTRAKDGPIRNQLAGAVLQPYEVGNCLTARMHKGINSTLDEGQTPVLSYAIQGSMIGRNDQAGPQGNGINEEVCFTQNTIDRHGVAYGIRTANTSSNGWGIQEEVTHTLDTAQGVAVAQPITPQPTMQVRRLTPVECERLQGFPDNYTNIPWRKKPESPDGPRYKALGNSWAVPVVRWIGSRIQGEINALA